MPQIPTQPEYLPVFPDDPTGLTPVLPVSDIDACQLSTNLVAYWDSVLAKPDVQADPDMVTLVTSCRDAEHLLRQAIWANRH